VPFVIVAPGVTQPGSQSTAPVSLMDIYPTLAELTGLTVASYVEGRSLVPLLADPSMPWNHPTLSTYGFGNHAVVSSTYKYIRYADGSEELYDVREDPNEWTNLAARDGYESVKQELGAYMPTEDAPDLALAGRTGGPGRGRGGPARGGTRRGRLGRGGPASAVSPPGARGAPPEIE